MIRGYESRTALRLSGRAAVLTAARRVPLSAATAVGAVLCAQIVTHLVDFGFFDLRIELLNAGYEWSYSHLLATLAFAGGAVCAGLGAASATRVRHAWLAACGLFGFMFVDNVTRLHEHIGAWPVFYAPLLLALSLALVAVSRETRHSGLVNAGLGLLFASLAVHVLGHQLMDVLGWGADSWGYQVKVALKEGVELAGWVLLVPALALLAQGTRASTRGAGPRSARP